jgi:hypothetical protein
MIDFCTLPLREAVLPFLAIPELGACHAVCRALAADVRDVWPTVLARQVVILRGAPSGTLPRAQLARLVALAPAASVIGFVDCHPQFVRAVLNSFDPEVVRAVWAFSPLDVARCDGYPRAVWHVNSEASAQCMAREGRHQRRVVVHAADARVPFPAQCERAVVADAAQPWLCALLSPRARATDGSAAPAPGNNAAGRAGAATGHASEDEPQPPSP